MDRRVTPPKRVTSPTWGPPPPCKQALGFDEISPRSLSPCSDLSSRNIFHLARTNLRDLAKISVKFLHGPRPENGSTVKQVFNFITTSVERNFAFRNRYGKNGGNLQ